MPLAFFLVCYFAFGYFVAAGHALFAWAAAAVMTVVFFLSNTAMRKQYAVVIVSGIVFLAAGEIYLRLSLFGPAALLRPGQYVPATLGSPLADLRYDPGTYTGLEAGQTGRLKGLLFQTNGLGFRDNDRRTEKKPGTIRIVVAGSSVSMGDGVSQYDSYPCQLEALLNRRAGRLRFEVINLSLCDYGIDDMIRVLEEIGIGLDPDVILLEDGFWEKRGLHKLRPLPAHLRTPAGRWFFAACNLPELSFFTVAIRNEMPAALKARFRTVLRRFSSVPEKAVATTLTESPEKVDAILGKLKGMAAGRKLFVVSLRPMKRLDRPRARRAWVERLCREHGLGYFSTLDEDYGTDVLRMVIYPGDRHPNRLAHAVYAESLARQLEPHVS